jgi:hypothetical protein
MKHSVVEPLQNVLQELPKPTIPTPDLHVPDAVVSHLPQRFRPEPPHRSRRPWLLALVLVVVAVVVVKALRGRRDGGDEIVSYNGSSSSRSNDASFADVR